MRIVKKRPETDDNFQSMLYENDSITWFDGHYVRHRTRRKLSEPAVELYRPYGDAGWYILGDKMETRYPSRRVAILAARIG